MKAISAVAFVAVAAASVSAVVVEPRATAAPVVSGSVQVYESHRWFHELTVATHAPLFLLDAPSRSSDRPTTLPLPLCSTSTLASSPSQPSSRLFSPFRVTASSSPPSELLREFARGIPAPIAPHSQFVDTNTKLPTFFCFSLPTEQHKQLRPPPVLRLLAPGQRRTVLACRLCPWFVVGRCSLLERHPSCLVSPVFREQRYPQLLGQLLWQQFFWRCCILVAIG